MRRLLLILIVIGLILQLGATTSYAQISDAAVLFLRIAPNARSAGMGEAFVAIADDASSTHWNPAGLGEYPLAHAWYQVSLGDDSRLKELAQQALEGKLSPEFYEQVQTWQVKGNAISRMVGEEWRESETIAVDPNRELLSSLSRRLIASDKERFKLAVRRICLANTSIAFEDINGMRTSLLRASGKEHADRINLMTEEVLKVWQDLRFNLEAFNNLKQRANDAAADARVTADELGELEGLATACATEARPAEIQVPYSVLLSAWRGWDVPWERQIQKIAVMENGVPNDNYTHFDIWALTNEGLMRYNGSEWVKGDYIQPRRGDNLKDIVARAIGTAKDEAVLPRLEQVARANNRLPLERLLEMRAAIEAALPEDLRGRTELLTSLGKLEENWMGCRLDNLRLTNFVDTYNKALADSAITETEGDRLLFALEKSYRDQLSNDLQFPFGAVFDGNILDIGVDHKMLYVGTTTGLYRYNGRSWEKFSTGGDSTAVWTIEVYKRGNIWIGTDKDVRALRDGKWTTFGVAEGVTAGPIKHIYVKNERQAWAATDDDLFGFDGTSWSNQVTYTTSVNDSAHTIMSKFYGATDALRTEVEAARLQAANPEFYATPKAGVALKLSHKPVFEGKITALEMLNNDLWVGTELGLKKFDGRSWTSYGYKAIKVEKAMSIEELAQEYLKTTDPDKVNSFVGILKQKNILQTGNLQLGRVVYVYANPAGSTINSLHAHGGKIYVGSIYGTFTHDDGRWERYYHENLQQANTRSIAGAGGEMWFATADRIVVFAQGKTELTFTHANWLPELASDLYYEFLSYVQPIGTLGTVGGNVTFLSYGTIPVTGESSSDITGEINPFDVALTLSYGTRASKSLAVGLSAKIIYSRLSVQGAGREVGEGSGTSFAVEGGMLYTITRRLRFGAVLTNLGPNMSYIDAAQSDALPRNLAIGFSYKLLDSPYNRLTLVGEINKLLATVNDDFSTEFKEAVENVGLEYWYGSLLALRGGYIYDQKGEIKTPTLGVGLQYKGRYRLDFAYIPSSENLPLANTLRTSLTVKL